MSKIEKLKQKFKKKPTPNDIRVDEAITLAKAYGCVVKTGGNHQIKIAHIKTGTIIPLPQHGNVLKEAYVEQLQELFDSIEGDE